MDFVGFSAEQKPDQPIDRHLFDKWLTVAKRAAKLPKLEGELWDPDRPKWATERKGQSLKDVAAADGWQGTELSAGLISSPATKRSSPW